MNLKNLARGLEPQVLSFMTTEDFNNLDNWVKETSSKVNTRITVIGVDGVVYADSEKDPHLMENHKDRIEVREAIEAGIGESLRFSTTVKEEMLYIAIPLELKGELVGILRVSVFLKDINRLLGNLRMEILYLAIIVVFAASFYAYFFSKNLSSPIKELTSASDKLASGDFNTKVVIKRKDELGKLAESFNKMREKLKELFDNLSSKQEELNSIISSLEEALFVLDKDGKVILFNESFKKIAQINPEDRFWWEVLRVPQVDTLMEKVIKREKISSQEIEWNDRIYLLSFSFTCLKEEIIGILHDITEFKRLEEIKKDFVVNVSHELRTPLTAIKGYIETLEEEIKDDSSLYYLNIIKRHTERLINIVSDLLLLSELEEKRLSRIEEFVDLKQLVENVFKIFKQRADEKNLKLNLYCEGITFVKGDSFKLEQMLINLIDNAIKYTEEGEVSVLLKEAYKKVIIEVNDTGIGIPKEYIPRIFERFYVVDKSRSRKLGGTGLGLSIVKHIVLLHNGKIEVESTLGSGSKFIITLPATPS